MNIYSSFVKNSSTYMVVSPNMHSHMHLSECIENYGPIQVFWLFSFEHYNGILGSYHTNQRAIEIQVMRKFCRDMTIKTLAYSEPAVEMHKQLFCTVLDDKVTGRKIQQWQYLYFLRWPRRAIRFLSVLLLKYNISIYNYGHFQILSFPNMK